MIPRFEPTASMGEILAFLGGCFGPAEEDAGAVTQFERRFAERQGADHAAFVPSGRMALWLLVKGLQYPEGSEIVVPAFTYFAIPAVLRLAGMVVVYAEIDPETYALTPESVAAVLTGKTRAVIPTHLFGRTCDMAGLDAVCAPRGIDLIEDCAQACGAQIGATPAGSVGQASYFTFGITKNFTTFSGGMLMCRDGEVHDRIRACMTEYDAMARGTLVKQGLTALAMRLGSYRWTFNLSAAPLLALAPSDGPDRIHRAFEERPHAITVGELRRSRRRPGPRQARAGMRQLDSLAEKNEARRRNGTRLRELLVERGCGGLPAPAADGGDHVYMSFAIRRPERYRFIAALRRRGIDTSPGYMNDCSSAICVGGVPGTCPASERVAGEVVHLPLYPGLRDGDLVRIADAVAAVDGRG